MRSAQSRMDWASVSGAAVLLISSHTRLNCSALTVGRLTGCAMVRSSWKGGPFHPPFQKAPNAPQRQLERGGAQALDHIARISMACAQGVLSQTATVGFSQRYSGVGVVVCQVAAQYAGCLGLCQVLPGFGFDALDGVGTGDEPQRRLLLVGDGQQGVAELGRVAGLPPVHALRKEPGSTTVVRMLCGSTL
ncbi:hypothetical protein [Streptomyces sp. NPDC054804]